MGRGTHQMRMYGESLASRDRRGRVVSLVGWLSSVDNNHTTKGFKVGLIDALVVDFNF